MAKAFAIGAVSWTVMSGKCGVVMHRADDEDYNNVTDR
jgi:hypothetical protein